MLKLPRFNFSQQYLDYGYKELTIPAGTDGRHVFETHALHIWPRGTFMLIALPNIDGTFGCILFLPFEGGDISFEALDTEAKVLSFFEAQFPDALRLMPNLIENYFGNPTGAMVTIKCSPWHVDGKALLLGDAAHAIVPFFGQGMNCAFEDCTYFLELLDRYGSDWPVLFSEFEKARKADTDAIADLAIENFVEMRDRVADPRFLFRKKVELELEKKYPGRFVPEVCDGNFSPDALLYRGPAGSRSGPHAWRALRFGAAARGHRLGEGRSTGAAEADSAARSVDGQRSLSTPPPALPQRWMRAIHWPCSGSNSIFRPGRTAARRSTSADTRSDFSRRVHAHTSSKNLRIGQRWEWKPISTVVIPGCLTIAC